LFFFVTDSLASQEYFGKYLGTVQSEWLSDGRKMKITADFSYEDPNGLAWVAKKGSEVDGASIPEFLWSMIGSPFSGKYREASVIHDIACDERNRTWEVSHLAFYYAMRASGVGSVRAKILYAGVYYFGPRWALVQQVEHQVAKTIFEKVCSWNGGVHSCIRVPRVIMQKVITDISVPPLVNDLTEKDFNRLKSEIENKEDTEPLSLDQIRSFR